MPAAERPTVGCDERLAAIVALLGARAWGPIDGFLAGPDVAAVSAGFRLRDGTPCPVPPTCEVPGSPGITAGVTTELRDGEGRLLGTVEVRAVEPLPDGRVRIAGPVRVPGAGPPAGPGAAHVVVVPEDTDPAAAAATRTGSVVQFAIGPAPLDDARAHRRLATIRRACGPDRVRVLRTPWAGRTPAELAHQALAARSAGATEVSLPPHAVAFVGELLPDLRLRPAPELDRRGPAEPRPGLTFFFTGLSGSGKSTIARALVDRLLDAGRAVTLLDGDVVRTHLSAGLGFTRADRETNIRRVGFVAAEVTKHGGVAVCALIAPYDGPRRSVRAMVEREGRFVLVHVATTLEVCEQRDVKGLYARARRGELTEFTGVSDPFEPPADADVVVDAGTGSVEDAVDRILAAVPVGRGDPFSVPGLGTV
ncbi:MAG TPA: adenylyl-sulfate kinase [Mycobacteriales bacterium]|nr:adenylyl-sulfate kinase [Mycobacteriales bacterium]